MTIKKFSKIFFKAMLLLLPVALIVAGTNYIVDPAQIFHEDDYERQIVAGMLSKKIVAINTNYNERRLQRILIHRLPDIPEGIVVGSSRVMSIPSRAFGFQNVINNGVSGAVLEDIIAIIGLYERNKILPDRIVIGVDFWLFNDNHGDTRYLELANEYNEFANTIGLSRLSGGSSWSEKLHVKITQALSVTYFQASLGNFGWHRPSPILATEISDDYMNKLMDGSIIYKLAYRTQPQEMVDRTAIEVINSTLYHSENYTELSPRLLNQFDQLVSYLQENDISVTFVFPPMHPLLYRHILTTPRYRTLLQTETYLREYAETRGIAVIGSCNPELVGAENKDFYDFMHPKREFMERYIMRYYLAANTSI